MNSEIYTPELLRSGRLPRLFTTSCRYCHALVRVDFKECYLYRLTADWNCPACYAENETNINLFFDTDDDFIE